MAYKGYSNEEYIVNNRDLHLNYLGLNNILFLSEKYNVQKVIILSSFKVYGDKKSELYIEKDRTLPESAEGNSYLSREALSKEYRMLGLNVVIIRAGAVYGPGQYGTDLSYIHAHKNSTGDFIHVEDLCNIIVKVMYNHTDPVLNASSGEGYSRILDSTKIRFSLDWYPKYIFEDEFYKAHKRSDNNTGDKEKWDKSHKKPVKIKYILEKLKNLFSNKDIEVIVIFLVTFIVNYFIKYRLGIETDLLLLYTVLISLVYGLKEGIIAASLSMIAFIWFSFSYYEKSVLQLATDLNSILYLMLYFFLGVCIGYLVEEQRKKRKYLMEEVNFVKEEINFIKELYSKSQEVNINLQHTIENYESNLTKTNYIVQKLDSESMDNIYEEIVDIYSDTFYAGIVNLYKLNTESNTLVLISYKGNPKYGKYINVNKYDFLTSVIKNRSIFVNKDFGKNLPTISIPLYHNDFFIGIVFLDDVEFTRINQYYLNNLKVTTSLIGSLAYRGFQYEKALKDNKRYKSQLMSVEKWVRNILGGR